jgi:hypothetical protein
VGARSSADKAAASTAEIKPELERVKDAMKAIKNSEPGTRCVMYVSVIGAVPFVGDR